MSKLITEIAEQHAKLRKLERDLDALRSQLRPARKRIRVAREGLDVMIAELASGQGSLLLFPEEPTSNGQAPSEPVPATEADRQPVRGRARKGAIV